MRMLFASLSRPEWATEHPLLGVIALIFSLAPLLCFVLFGRGRAGFQYSLRRLLGTVLLAILYAALTKLADDLCTSSVREVSGNPQAQVLPWWVCVTAPVLWAVNAHVFEHSLHFTPSASWPGWRQMLARYDVRFTALTLATEGLCASLGFVFLSNLFLTPGIFGK